MKLERKSKNYYKVYLYQCINTLVFISILFFTCPESILAVDITYNTNVSSISTEDFNVNVNILGANDGKNYLRIDLFREGSTNYFGETYNGSEWFSGSDGTRYFPVDILNASASATIKGHIGNPSQSEYQGPGLYKLKIRRYTSSGNPSSSDTQIPIDIQITYSTPSPTQAPTQQPTSSPTTAPTQAPTAKPTPTTSPSPKPSINPTPAKETEETNKPEAIQQSNNLNHTPVGMVAGDSTEKGSPILAIMFVVLGTACLGYVGYLLYNQRHVKISDNS